jgi:hypothetical protein
MQGMGGAAVVAPPMFFFGLYFRQPSIRLPFTPEASMQSWRALSTSLALILILVLLGGLVPPESGTALAANPQAASLSLGTTFTYQGRLIKDATPLTDTCDLRFRLFDDVSSGSQVGATQTLPAESVSDGYFTVGLDFGQNAFNGEARWLEIAAQCTGDGGFTALAPRQPLTPAPYALALPGLYTQQNATSPNIIGGYSGNTVTNTVVGATISGGGDALNIHQVTDNYGTVGGGGENRAGDNAGTVVDATYATVGGGSNNVAGEFSSTVGGGNGNDATGDYSTVGGGSGNLSDDNYSTIGGGSSNEATGGSATVAGGSGNVASESYATVAGGADGVASGTNSTVGGGSDNQATGGYSTIAGGESNQAIADNATVGGGEYNQANAQYSTVPGGYQAVASHWGEMAYSSGMFANFGDAQTSMYFLRTLTTSAASTELFLDGTGGDDRMTVPNNSVWAFDMVVAGRAAATDSGAGYRVVGVIENAEGVVSFIGTPTVSVLGEDVPAWVLSVTADNTNDALTIFAQGTTGTNIRWVAVVRTAQVFFN